MDPGGGREEDKDTRAAGDGRERTPLGENASLAGIEAGGGAPGEGWQATDVDTRAAATRAEGFLPEMAGTDAQVLPASRYGEFQDASPGAVQPSYPHDSTSAQHHLGAPHGQPVQQDYLTQSPELAVPQERTRDDDETPADIQPATSQPPPPKLAQEQWDPSRPGPVDPPSEQQDVQAQPEAPADPGTFQFADEQDLVVDDSASDSALGSDGASATTSLSESIYNYRKEHGRTYHAYKDGKYIFPNDEHQLFRITFGEKLFFAPLVEPRRCLDVGTGTGIWAIDFADEFPSCQTVGIDLSPGQPGLVPPNLKFVVDDAEDLWIYEEKFDFIHLRLMAGCFSDWQNVFRQAYENLEPGGWLELQDYGLPVKSADGTADNTDVMRWGELLCESSRALGRPLGSDCADYYEPWMRAAGFVDIQVRMFMWPSNGWPKDRLMKELGRWNQINVTEGLEGFCLALMTRGLGWRKEEIDVFVARVARDLADRRIHAYFPMPVVFGRKPWPGEVVFA